MATTDIEESDWGNALFSKQYCGQLIQKVVRIGGVVQQFIDSTTISEAERKSLGDKKVADEKLRHLLTIITDHCNRHDLQAFKTFIDILGETNNGNVAQQLSQIYKERVAYLTTLRLLLDEKTLVNNLQNKISGLQGILEEKEIYLESLTDEKNKLVNEKETFREEKLSLEKQIKEKEKVYLLVVEEIGDLTRRINDLEAEVEHKSNVIRKRDKEIAEKEQEVRKAIEESNGLRLKIDKLHAQQSKSMVEDKEMSKKIEILEEELVEKENTIINLRRKKTMTLEEIKEELGNITKGQEKKLVDQTAMIKQQAEHIESLAKAQMATAKQHAEQIDSLTKAQMASANQHAEQIDSQTKAQMASAKEQNEKIDLLTDTLKKLLKSQEKK